MPISFDCPHCARKLKVSDQHAGRRASCPGCQSSIVVPSAVDVAVVETPADPIAKPGYAPLNAIGFICVLVLFPVSIHLAFTLLASWWVGWFIQPVGLMDDERSRIFRPSFEFMIVNAVVDLLPLLFVSLVVRLSQQWVLWGWVKWAMILSGVALGVGVAGAVWTAYRL